MKALVIASGVKGSTVWAALASESGGQTIRGIVRSAADPKSKTAVTAAPAVGSQVNVFIEARPERTVTGRPAINGVAQPDITYAPITLIYLVQ